MPLTYEKLAEAMSHMAIEKSEWAGLPMPLPDAELILEPKFPYQLGQFGLQRQFGPNKVINRWWCSKLGCNVVLSKNADGKVESFYEPFNRAMMTLNTFTAVVAWPMEAEFKAQDKLLELISEHAFKNYMMAGAFLETSKRSGITYMFRRLRPTLAISCRTGTAKVLCGLCAHSIGYYAGTWAGVMVPTDEVVSHLIFMRGDEPKFWKMCNQHPAEQPQSGL